MKTIEHFNSYIEELVGQLSSIKQRQDLERRKLIELRDQIKTSITAYKEVSNAPAAWEVPVFSMITPRY